MAKQLLVPVSTKYYDVESFVAGECFIDFQKDLFTISWDFIADELKNEDDENLGKERKRTMLKTYALRERLSSIQLNLSVHNSINRFTVNLGGMGLNDYNIFFIKRKDAEDLLNRALEWWNTGIDPVEKL